MFTLVDSLTIDYSSGMTIDKEQFDDYLAGLGIKQPKAPAKRYEWDNILAEIDEPEIQPFFTRSLSSGVVVFRIGAETRTAVFVVGKKVSDKSGASKPIICDLCKTQRSNGDTRLVTFYRSDLPPSRQHDISWLCCKDLMCSAHVRNLTHASLISRSQLRETQLDHNAQQVVLSEESMKKRLVDNTNRLFDLIYKNT
jgi:hypothetical protein